MYINCKAGHKGSMTKDVSILGREAYLDFLCWGRAHVLNILVICQPNGSFQNEKNQKLVGKTVKITVSRYPNGWVGTGSSRSK
jgi:hypothetical protein